MPSDDHSIQTVQAQIKGTVPVLIGQCAHLATHDGIEFVLMTKDVDDMLRIIRSIECKGYEEQRVKGGALIQIERITRTDLNG